VSEPKPCPFCGIAPNVYPVDPKREGSAWGSVQCDNEDCPAQPRVFDNEPIADERGSDAYKEAAIKRWNMRNGEPK